MDLSEKYQKNPLPEPSVRIRGAQKNTTKTPFSPEELSQAPP